MYLSLVQGIDYVGQTANLAFAYRDSRRCHTVNILQDSVCEHPNLEDFFANLTYVSGLQIINIVRDRTRVPIDDSSEPECGESRLSVANHFAIINTSAVFLQGVMVCNNTS